MSAVENKAVFLSYASQDAEAALRICEALRASGVEVWFDQSELVGGDAWDAKIRKQIKECALFVPVISAATQARREGYFRIEWKLAAQRTHAMADGTPFLLPVVIDETRDGEALVPAEFKAVQWTRLPGGETSAAFCARVKILLGGPTVGGALRPDDSDRPAESGRKAPPTAIPRRAWLVLAAVAFVAVGFAGWRWSQRRHASAPAPDKSVAVLAFKNLIGDKEQEYFSDGLSEELSNVLGRVPGLRVAGSTSAFSFKDKPVPLPEIARQLGVAHVVEGTVRREGNTVRITARLINAADGLQVWTSGNLRRKVESSLALQEEIAGLIAKELSLKLGVASAATTTAVNPQAFELYLQARQAWNLRTAAGFERAEELLNRVLALEPIFARAHAALADVWSARGQVGTLGLFGKRNSPEFSRIVSENSRALEIDPGCAEAHASLGVAAWLNWDNSQAVRELRLAIRLNPNYASAHQWLGRVLISDGRVDEALTELKLATEIDPLSFRIFDNYSAILRTAGRYTEALVACDRSLAVQPDNAQALWGKALALTRLHRFDEAIALVNSIKSDRAVLVPYQIPVLAAAGRRTEAEALLPQVRLDTPADAKAAALLALDRNEEALDALQSAGISATSWGLNFYDSNFDAIRSDPRFIRLLREVGSTEAHTRAQAWRAAHPPEKTEAKK